MTDTFERAAPPSPVATAGKIVLLTLLLAEFMIQIDATIVNVSLPAIQQDLGFTGTSLAWVVNGYMLCYGGLLLLGGRLADVYGRRLVLMTGVSVFTVASVLCGLAGDPVVLVLARALQGIGAAAAAPAVLSLIITSFREGAERNGALAAWGGASAGGSLFGLLIGGVLTSTVDWRWIFYINVPVGLAIVALAPFVLKESKAASRPSLDAGGAITITAALLVITYALLGAHGGAGLDLGSVGLLVLGALLLAVFVAVEKRHHEPLIPMSLFANRNTAGSLGATALFGTTQMGYFFFVTLYLQNVLGFSAIQTGLSYLPLIAALAVTTTLANKIIAARGVKAALVPGLVLIIAGLGWLSQVPVDGSWVGDVLGPTVLAGLGIGLTFVPLSISATSGVDPRDAGAVSGLFNVAVLIGGSIGIAVLTIASGLTGEIPMLPLPTPTPEAIGGFQGVFLTGAGLAVLALLVCAAVLRVPHAPAAVPAEEKETA